MISCARIPNAATCFQGMTAARPLYVMCFRVMSSKLDEEQDYLDCHSCGQAGVRWVSAPEQTRLSWATTGDKL